jgi:hypothetical protein
MPIESDFDWSVRELSLSPDYARAIAAAGQDWPLNLCDAT